jgi:3-oxoacyl-[acyl-carrier-protein] synthase II
VIGTAVGGDATGSVLPDPRGTCWSSVLARAIERAGVAPEEVSYVACAANGATALDSIETGVIAGVLGSDVVVSAPKSITGETLGASGAVSFVAALVALETGTAPPTAGLTDPVGGDRVRHVIGEPLALRDGIAVANAFSLGGNYGCIVVAR